MNENIKPWWKTSQFSRRYGFKVLPFVPALLTSCNFPFSQPTPTHPAEAQNLDTETILWGPERQAFAENLVIVSHDTRIVFRVDPARAQALLEHPDMGINIPPDLLFIYHLIPESLRSDKQQETARVKYQENQALGDKILQKHKAAEPSVVIRNYRAIADSTTDIIDFLLKNISQDTKKDPRALTDSLSFYFSYVFIHAADQAAARFQNRPPRVELRKGLSRTQETLLRHFAPIRVIEIKPEALPSKIG